MIITSLKTTEKKRFQLRMSDGSDTELAKH